MIRLEPGQRLVALITAPLAEGSVACVFNYSDQAEQDYPGAVKLARIVSTDAVTVCEAPDGEGVVCRDADYASLANQDTADAIVSVMYELDAEPEPERYLLATITIPAGGRAEYTNQGWRRISAAGSVIGEGGGGGSGTVIAVLGTGVVQVDNSSPTTPVVSVQEDETHRFVTDAQKAAWDAKQPALNFTPENAANRDASGGYAGLSGFAHRFRSGVLGVIASLLTSAATQARSWALPDADGTLALREDLVNFVLASRTVNGHALTADVVVTQSDVGLPLANNTADIDKPVSTQQAAADTAVLNAAQAYSDGLVTGMWNDRGNYDASGNTFPAAGGSGAGGAIKKGNIWTVSVPGTLGGVDVALGDTVRALANAPGQVAASWAVGEANIGYVPENLAKKNASSGYAGLSATFALTLKNAAGAAASTLQSLATQARAWNMPDKDGTVAMVSDITSAQAGLGNLTNDAQTKAVIVPNTPPASGQVLVGNAGGTAYAPVTLSGDATVSAAGTLVLANVNANVGTFTNATVTANAKGQVTAISAGAGASPGAPSGSLQGNIGGAFAAIPNWSFDTTTGAKSYAGGTVPVSTPPITLSQTWNDATKTFEFVRYVIADTDADPASKFFEIGPPSGNPFLRLDRSGTGGQATARLTVGAGKLHSQAIYFDPRSSSGERISTGSGNLTLGFYDSDIVNLIGTTLRNPGTNAVSAAARSLTISAGNSLGGIPGPGGVMTTKAGDGIGSGQPGGDSNVVGGAGGLDGNGGAVNINGGAGNGTGAAGDVWLANLRGSVRAGGLFFPHQRTSVTEPSYLKGAMFFNTDLGKNRIGGNAGWETVTSV